MIVLDEQLLGYGLRAAISKWYRGSITDLPVLRPGTLILDEAIPELLRAARQPTFVTINVRDFWRRMVPERRFCILCFALPDQRVAELPGLLRRVFATEPFRTRRKRLGKIGRVTPRRVAYYTAESWAVRTIDWYS
jgi:hypothetical protein